MIPATRAALAMMAGICLLHAWTVEAHQQKTAITTLLFNERSGHLEVSHRFYAHDAEHAVKRVLKTAADLIGDPTTRDQFGHYVEEHFGLRISDREPLQLAYVGHELKGKFFWVYQEIPIPANISQLEVFHSSLQALWPSQINLVNIEGRGAVQSLRFTVKDSWQRVKLEPIRSAPDSS